MTGAPACRICGSPTVAAVTAREMMFGLRHEFVYDECGDCGCVQLRTEPADWTPYYPASYYSLQAPQTRSGVRELIRRTRNRLLYRAPFRVASVLARMLAKVPSEAHAWLHHTATTPQSRILDVGSGVGLLVRDLGDAGFSSVMGIDPFIAGPVQHASGARVEKATIDDTGGSFDLVMFHHSLEHMAQQLAVLRRAAELLAPGGWCLIRVPVASSYAWRHYRQDWVQLDPPRHYVLHTVESLTRAGTAAGLTLQHLEHDSTELQFWGSEAYRRDVPLIRGVSLFTSAEMRAFRRRAAELNGRGEGDQACFYFQKPGGSAVRM